MKIVVNARFLTQPLSGVQRYGIECSRQIKKLCPDAVFVAPRNILHTDIARELDVRGTGYNTGHVWEQLDLPLFLAGRKHPPLLSLANTAPLLYSNNYVTIHDLAFYHHPDWNSKRFSAWYNILVPRVATGARHIFTVSNTVRAELVKHYHLPATKVTVAYNGISEKMLSLGPRSGSDKENIILAVGTFNIRKNHPNLVNAYLGSSLRDSYQLVIIGDRNKIFRDSLLDEQAVAAANIKIYETMDEDELVSTYRRSAILASLSLYEGFGIPVLEGLYNGCKVVCSDIPIYRELYDGYVTFCDPLSVPGITAALETAAAAPPATVGQAAGLTAKYSYRRAAEAILARIAVK